MTSETFPWKLPPAVMSQSLTRPCADSHNMNSSWERLFQLPVTLRFDFRGTICIGEWTDGRVKVLHEVVCLREVSRWNALCLVLFVLLNVQTNQNNFTSFREKFAVQWAISRRVSNISILKKRCFSLMRFALFSIALSCRTRA